jgi:hypothetical protein
MMRVGHLLVALVVLAAAAGGCARCDAPSAPVVPEASVAQPASMARDAAPDLRDAGPDVVDARSDASDAAVAVRHVAKKPVAAPSGGGAGFKVEGSLPRSDAEKIVRGGLGKLRACNPDLKGRVTFRLTIDDRGRVSLGEVVKSTIGGGDPEMCMIRAARDFKFPAAAGESTVTFQMTF